MLVETNRLHQKIKKLKDDLAREKELRKKAERELKALSCSVTSVPVVVKTEEKNDDIPNVAAESMKGLRVNRGSNHCSVDTQTEHIASSAFSATQIPGNITSVQMRNKESQTVGVSKTQNAQTETSHRLLGLEFTEPSNIGLVINALSGNYNKKIQKPQNAESNTRRSLYVPEGHKERSQSLDVDLHISPILPGEEYSEVTISVRVAMKIKLAFNEARQEDPKSPIIAEYSSIMKNHNFAFVHDILDRNLPDDKIWSSFEAFFFDFQAHHLAESEASINGKIRDYSMPNVLYSLGSTSDKLKFFSYIELIRFYVFIEDYHQILAILERILMEPEDLQIDVKAQCCYIIGFAFLIIGKFAEAAGTLQKLINWLEMSRIAKKNEKESDEEFQLFELKINAQICIAYCISSSSKLKKSISPNLSSIIKRHYSVQMGEWKYGKIDTFWNFFATCSPFIRNVNSPSSDSWKLHNLKSIEFCLQTITKWKALRNLKGMLKICGFCPYRNVPVSILPVTTHEDIQFFCENHVGLTRLFTCKISGISKIVHNFPNIHHKGTLVFLIMKYHEALQKSAKTDAQILEFGKKFVLISREAQIKTEITDDDAMSYIREVAKISMEAANRFVNVNLM